jgi:hypothetical protein
MRKVGRRREFEDKLLARRLPAFELLETSPSGCSIVSENPGKRSPEKNISLVRCRPISSRLSTALTPFSAASFRPHVALDLGVRPLGDP